MGLFDGKVAFVTGGASGIGFGIAKRLVEEGAKVAIGDINTSFVNASAVKLGKGVIAIEVDVSNPNSVESAIRTVEEKLGGLDLAVNAAGIMGSIGSIADTNPQETMRVLAVNLAGVIYSMKYEILAMRKKKGAKSAIVNIASTSGTRPHPFLGHYSSSKAGVIAITKVAAVENGPDGIRVNSISPGHTETPMVPKDLDREHIASTLPTRRIGRVEDIADTAAFLLSSAAGQVTGVNIPVDGGYLADNPIAVPGH